MVLYHILYFFLGDYMIEPKFRQILIDFSMLIDTDEGCIKYLLKQYPNSVYFNDYMKSCSDYFIRYSLLNRTDYNPLSVLLKNEYRSSIDSLYKELLKEKWEEVLELSPITDILKFLNTMLRETGYSLTVNCRNIHEQVKLESLDNIDKSWRVQIDCKDIRKYFCLFIKNMLSLSNKNRLEGKTMYFYDYGPNFSDYKKKEVDPVLALLSKTNIIKFISPYNDFEFPVDENITMEDDNNEISNKRS